MRTAAAALILALVPALASAQDAGDEADRHYRQGQALYEAGNYAAALPELERAYARLEGRPSRPAVLYALALTYEALFQYERAIDAFERYLAQAASDAPGRADVEARLRVLRALLGLVRIRTNVPRAEVWIDGRHVGDAPGDLRVPGGRHALELRAPGMLTAQRELSVAARETVTLTIDLERPSRGIGRGWFWGTAGGAVLALGVGAVYGGLALAARGDLDDQGFVATEDERLHVERLALTADVFFAGAALLAVAAGVLFFVTDWD